MNENNNNINENLLLSYLKLLTNLIESYTKLHQNHSFPTSNELKSNKETLSNILKKINIIISILMKKSQENNHKELNHILQFNFNLLKDSDIVNKTSKLNVLSISGIILTKIINTYNKNNNNENNKFKIDDLMIEYLQSLMKNFYCTYHDSIYSLYESISVNLCELTHCQHFFDYEYIFLYDKQYIDNELIDKINENIKKLNLYLEDNIVEEFEIDNLHLKNNIKNIIYLHNILIEMKTFKKYKNSHKLDEYNLYKKQIKNKYISK